MADSDRTLEVLVRILTEQVGQEKADEIMANLRTQTDKTTDSTEEFNIKGRAQFLLFSELNRVVPQLGTLLHAAFAGPLAPIILVGVAIAAAKKALDGYNESLDNMGESAAAGHIEYIQTLRDAWDNVEEGMAKYFTDLKSAAQDKDPTKTLIENLKKLQEEQFKAEIEQMKLLGRPQSQIDALQDEHDKKTVALLQEERGLRVADLTNAQFALDKDNERAALADARVSTHKAELAALQKPDTELDKRIEQARSLVENAKKMVGQIPFGARPEDIAASEKNVAQRQSELDTLLNEQRLRETRRQQLENAKPADLTAKEVADNKLKEDQLRTTAAQSRITELSGPQGEIAQTALREEAARASRSSNEIIEQAKGIIKNHADQVGEILATMRFYNSHAGSITNEVTALRHEIEAVQRQLANLPH